MNIKVMLIVALIVVLLLGAVSYGYMVYAIYQDGTAKAGADMIKTHQVLCYVQLAMYILGLGLGAGLFYKR